MLSNLGGFFKAWTGFSHYQFGSSKLFYRNTWVISGILNLCHATTSDNKSKKKIFLFLHRNSWYYKGMNISSVPLFRTNAHDISSVIFFMSKKGHYQDKKYWSICVKYEQQYLLIMSILITQSSVKVYIIQLAWQISATLFSRNSTSMKIISQVI